MEMKRLVMAAFAALSVGTIVAADDGKRPNPDAPSTIELITLVNDGWQRLHPQQTDASWSEVAYHAGNQAACQLLDVARWQAYSDTWERHCRRLGLQVSDSVDWQRRANDEGNFAATAIRCHDLLRAVNDGQRSRNDCAAAIDEAWQYLAATAPGRAMTGVEAGAFLLAACEHLRYEDAPAASTASDGSAARTPVVTVAISNESDDYRQQVVELRAGEIFSRLGIQGGRQFVVCDAAGLEVPYQLSYDDKVLVDAGVSPHSTLKLSIRRGTPRIYDNVCYGRLYPERKDDYAWENDRGAYRVYGPALQRTGEKSYGIDVWSKNTPELVVEQRYWIEDVVTLPRLAAMRPGNARQADSIYRSISYHYDHGRGMDLYKVGPTLGCGTPALMQGDALVYPYCFTDYEVLDNGPLRTTVLLNYEKKAFGADSIVEHRLISLDKGSNFNRMTVWYTGLRHKARLASGVVVHSEDTESVVLASDYVAYADPTDNPRVDNCQLFVATLYPEGQVSTCMLPLDQPVGGSEGHALGIADDYDGRRFTYYFGSAWSKYDVRTMREWLLRIGWTLDMLRHPLKVEIVK